MGTELIMKSNLEIELKKAINQAESLFDKSQLEAFEEANKMFKELVKKGWVKERYNLLSISDPQPVFPGFNQPNSI